MPEVNEAIASMYLLGTNRRRLEGALRPLLRAAPLSRSAVSRAAQALKRALDERCQRKLDDLDVAYLSRRDRIARVPGEPAWVSTPVLAAVAGAHQFIYQISAPGFPYPAFMRHAFRWR